jgi:phosphatidyl-myo-inositol dimannoside synthase
MRALLLCTDFPPRPGGIQTMMGSLAAALSDWELTVVAPAQPEAATYDSRQPYRVLRARGLRTGGSGRQNLPGIALRAFALAARSRPDLVLCGHPIDGLAGALMHRVWGLPYWVFCYGKELRNPRLRRLLPRIFARAEGLLTISRFTTREAAGLGVLESRVRQLPLGFDPHRFAQIQSSPLPQQLGLAGRRWLLTVARLDDRHKGIDTVLRAMPMIAAAVPDVRYVVAGDGRLRPELEALAERLGCRERVLFPGRVSEADLAALYARCTAFVLASRDRPEEGGVEGFGLVFLEANSFGKPVLGGNSGGIPDAVLDGVTGLLVDPEDETDVARQAIRLLTDGALAASLGNRGRERVLRELSWSATAQSLQTIVEESLGTRRHATPSHCIP